MPQPIEEFGFKGAEVRAGLIPARRGTPLLMVRQQHLLVEHAPLVAHAASLSRSDEQVAAPSPACSRSSCSRREIWMRMHCGTSSECGRWCSALSLRPQRRASRCSAGSLRRDAAGAAKVRTEAQNVADLATPTVSHRRQRCSTSVAESTHQGPPHARSTLLALKSWPASSTLPRAETGQTHRKMAAQNFRSKERHRSMTAGSPAGLFSFASTAGDAGAMRHLFRQSVKNRRDASRASVMEIFKDE